VQRGALSVAEWEGSQSQPEMEIPSAGSGQALRQAQDDKGGMGEWAMMLLVRGGQFHWGYL